MVSADLIVSIGLSALSAILVLALAALGLGIIFGLMGVINTAHGAFFTIGAYTVWFFSSELGVGFWIGFIAAPLIGGITGLITERLVVRHVYDRLLDSILATWGVALTIGELIKFAFGSTVKQVDNPLPMRIDLVVTQYPVYRLFMMAFAATVLLVVFGFVYNTNFGIRLRAVIQDTESAELLGINQTRMYQFSFSFGTALAAIAGASIAPFTTIGPEMGLNYLLQSFFAIIVGGSGTLIGIIPGSIVVGGFTNVMIFLMQPIVAQTIIFVIVIVIILIRPTGIIAE